MKNIFTRHPNSIGETYLAHFVKGTGFGLKLMFIALKVLIHAIIPCFFENVASDKLADLNEELQKRKKVN